MEKTQNLINRLLLTIVLVVLAPEVYPESPYRKAFYNMFINRDMNKWGVLIHKIETVKPTASVDQKLEFLDYYYGYIGHLIGKKQYETAELELTHAEKLLNEVLRVAPGNATAYAYKGSFVGFHIAISKLKSIYLSREVDSYIDKAFELDSQNVQANIDRGNSFFYSPWLVGGDKNEALNYYLRAAKLIEKNKETDQNWRYLNILTLIAITYEKLDMTEESKLAYEKVLRYEPNYTLVKSVLYPKLLAKLNN
jgi:tetratricopeptide (TPR) repeat protein